MEPWRGPAGGPCACSTSRSWTGSWSMASARNSCVRWSSANSGELLRRVDLYPRTDQEISGKTVLLIDDGLATGATMRAAVEAVREGGAETVVAAAPVGSIEAESSVERVCDAVLCLHLPGKFRAVGSFYRHFEQLTDDDAISYLKQ
jgi:putative phosphoribosyl transferase